MGQTCGLKMVYETRTEPDICMLCHDTAKKRRQYDEMIRHIQRWQHEGGRNAIIEKTRSEMHCLIGQIYQMKQEHDIRTQALDSGMTFQPVSSTYALGAPSPLTPPTASFSLTIPTRPSSLEFDVGVQNDVHLRRATSSCLASTLIPTAPRTRPRQLGQQLGLFQDASVYRGQIPIITTPFAQTNDQNISKAPQTAEKEGPSTYEVGESATNKDSTSTKTSTDISDRCLICVCLGSWTWLETSVHR